jgi:hypothetical protein
MPKRIKYPLKYESYEDRIFGRVIGELQLIIDRKKATKTQLLTVLWQTLKQ